MSWSWFTLAWLLLFVALGVIETIALFNSGRGDTLSEHLWAWLGVRTRKWGSVQETSVVTPVWTLRVARIVFIFALVWFGLHIVTGGWV